MDTAIGDSFDVDFTSSDKRDSPVLPHPLDRVPPDKQIDTLAGGGAFTPAAVAPLSWRSVTLSSYPSAGTRDDGEGLSHHSMQ